MSTQVLTKLYFIHFGYLGAWHELTFGSHCYQGFVYLDEKGASLYGSALYKATDLSNKDCEIEETHDHAMGTLEINLLDNTPGTNPRIVSPCEAIWFPRRNVLELQVSLQS